MPGSKTDPVCKNIGRIWPNRLSYAIFYQTGIPFFAYLYLYYRALANRRDVWVHSANLLAMPFLLWESPFSRILKQYVPAYHSDGFDIPTIVAAISNRYGHRSRAGLCGVGGETDRGGHPSCW